MSTTVAEFTALDRSEAELRVQLAAAYRLVVHFGWNESIYGHLTVRVPGPERHFLINPYGLNYDEITASNLVKIDCDGNIVEPSDYPVKCGRDGKMAFFGSHVSYFIRPVATLGLV